MQVDPPRPLTAQERSLVDALLKFEGQAVAYAAVLGAHRVVAVCDCGCGSFEMALTERSAPDTFGRQVVDAYGRLRDGRTVGLLLWGNDEQLTYMELYSISSDPPYELPDPLTLSREPADPLAAG
jgi:hypothetical protein